MEFLILACFIALILFGIRFLIKAIKREKHRFSLRDQMSDLVMNDKSQIICLDSETTGLNPKNDELLQLSIIDGNGNVLFNEYIKPSHRKSWRKAEEIHGISPEIVKDKLSITNYKAEINRIIEGSSLIVGYNHYKFDLMFLRKAGIIPYSKRVVDVMENFSPIYGDRNPKYKDYTHKSLGVCAKYYKYPYYKAHDSLEDAKATLYCFYKMEKRKQIKIIHVA